MTKAIYMAIKLDQVVMVTNMCVKFGEDWTNSFQELDQKHSSGRTDGWTYVRTRATLYAATLSNPGPIQTPRRKFHSLPVWKL